MNRDILIDAINRNLTVELILFLVIIFIYWFFVFKLGLRILSKDFSLPRTYPAIIVMSLFNIVRLLVPIPFPLMMIIMSGLLILLMGLLSRAAILRVIWVSVLVIFISGAIEIIVLSPLSLNSDISNFLRKTIHGNLVCSLSEILPLVVALFSLNKYPNLSLIPEFRNKPHKIERLCVVGLCFAFFLVYSISNRLLESMRTDFGHIKPQLINEWLASMGMAVIIYTTFVWTKAERKEQVLIKQQDETKIKLLEEQNQTLNAINGHLTEQITTNNEELKDLKKTISNQQDYNTWLILQTKLKMRAEDDTIPVADNLTRRELEILRLITLGRTNGEIAAELYLSDNTVKKYTSDIMAKLNLHNRVQLAVYAFARGLISEEELNLKSETSMDTGEIDSAE